MKIRLLKKVDIKRVTVILLLVSLLLPMAIVPIETFANSDIISNQETQDSLVEPNIPVTEEIDLADELSEYEEFNQNENGEGELSELSKTEELGELKEAFEVSKENVISNSLEENIDTNNMVPNETFLSRFELYTIDGRSAYYSGEDIHLFMGLDRADTVNDSIVNTQIVLNISSDNIDKGNLKPSIFYDGDKEIIPTITEDRKLGKFLITYTFENLNSGMSFDIGTMFKTNNYSTPNNSNVIIEAESIINTDRDSFTIGKSNLNLSIKTYSVKSSNQVVTEKTENSIYRGEQTRLPSEVTESTKIPEFSAGLENLSKPGYLSSDLSELSFITFSYGLSKKWSEHPGLGDVGDRRYSSIKIEDRLPLGAVFIQEANPGWIYNEADRSLIYIRNKTFSLGDVSLGNEYNKEDRVRLELKFPDHRLSDVIERDTSFTLTQNKLGENEAPIEISSKGYLKLTGSQPPTDIVVRKSGVKLYDNLSSKSGIHYYDVNIESQADMTSSYNIYDLIIKDYNLDSNLTYENIKFPADVESKFVGHIDIIIEYEEESGEIKPITVKDNIKVTNSLEIDMPSNLNKSKIKSVILRAKSESLILPSKALELKIGVAFKTPSSKILNDDDNWLYLKNYIEVSANYNHLNPAKIKYTGASSSFRNAGFITLLPINHQITLNKIQGRSSATFQTGDEVVYFMNVDTEGIVDDADYDFTYIVDFIPDGLDYVSGSSNIYMMIDVVSDELSNGLLEPTLISNFRNSGRRALVWKLDSMSTKGARPDGILFNITYKLKINKYLNKGSHEIPALLAWRNIDDLAGYEYWDTSLVRDIYDLNDNGLITDNVLESKTALKVQPNKQLIISKKVKGDLDNNYIFEPGVGLSEIGSGVKYEFEINNRTDVDLYDVQILDIIPHIGDKTVSIRVEDNLRVPRGTTTPIMLKNKVTPPAGFIVEYTDKPIIDDMSEFMNDDGWFRDYRVDELYKITAFRLKLQEGKSLNSNSIIKFYAEFSIPNNSELTGKDIAVNSFALSKGSASTFFESNLASLNIVKYRLDGKLYLDIDKDGTFKESVDKPITNYTVTLTDENGDVVLDSKGNPYITQTNSHGYYQFNIHSNGRYKVKILTPPNYSSAENSPILDDTLGLTSKLLLDKNNRELTLNVGYIDNSYIEETPPEPTLAKLTLSNTEGVGKPEITLDNPVDLIKGARYKLIDESGILIKEITLKDGQVIIDNILYGEYTLREISPPVGYKVSSPSEINFTVNRDNLNIVFKNRKEIEQVPLEPSTRDLSVKKTWIGGSMSKVVVNLLANNLIVDTVELSETNNWSYVFQGLPTVNKIADKIPISYTVSEELVTGYKTEIVGDADAGFEIINTKIVEQVPIEPISKVNIQVSKLWIGKKLETATINLMLDGEFIMSAKLSEDNGWKHTFENLDVTNSLGEMLVYSINETPIENYNTTINGNIKDGFVVINKEMKKPVVPSTISVSVLKKWVGKPLESVRVNLYANNKYKEMAILNKGNRWKHTFDNLVEFADSGKVNYTIEEEVIDGYKSEVTGSMLDGFLITNTEITPSIPTPTPNEPDTNPLPTPENIVKYIDLNVKKVWSDYNREEITIVLLSNGLPVDRVNLKPEDDMEYTFRKLISLDAKGNKIHYSIFEDKIEGYYSTIIGNQIDGFVIYNKKVFNDKEEVKPEVEQESEEKLEENSGSEENNEEFYNKEDINILEPKKDKIDKVDTVIIDDNIKETRKESSSDIYTSKDEPDVKTDDNGVVLPILLVVISLLGLIYISVVKRSKL